MALLNLRRFQKKAVTPEKRPSAIRTPAVAPVGKKASRKLAVSAAPKLAAPAGAPAGAVSLFLAHPRVSEKAAFLKERNCYVFEVPPSANKRLVAEAVKKMYNKTPIQVRMLPIPKKKIVARGRRGSSGGGKKAYVFMKQGETIEI